MTSTHRPSDPFRTAEELDPYGTSITTTVFSDMPPPERRPSTWGKMFGGFKFNENEDGSVPKNKATAEDGLCPVEKGVFIVHERPNNQSNNNVTPPAEEQKRSLSTAFADVFRRGSDQSAKSGRAVSPVRKSSTGQQHPGSQLRKGSLFQSSNPDFDSMDGSRKLSTTSNHSSGPGSRNGSVAVPTPERRPSYVPRNATSSFLTSTSLKTAEERFAIQNGVSAAGAARKASAAAMSDSGLSDSGHSVGQLTTNSVPSGRRPSGMVPNTVSARYMRNASLGGDTNDNDGERRGSRSSRRASTKSRQNSTEGGASSGKVQPANLQPEQHAQWQNAVSRSMNRIPFTKPGETLERHRMQSLSGIGDIAEAQEEQPVVAAAATNNGDTVSAPKSTSPELRVQPASPPRAATGAVRRQFSIDTFKANQEQGKLDAGRVDTARFLEDQISPMASSFGGKGDAAREERERRPESPLETLGFRGAVPA